MLELRAVATVVALDVIAASAVAGTHRRSGPARNYSARSGLPQGVEGSRGLAVTASATGTR